MKIPFTFEPLVHSKGSGIKEKTKRRGKHCCSFYLTMRFKATASKNSWSNQNVSAQHTVDAQWNDVTTVPINHHLNLLPLQGAIIQVSTNPQHM